MMRMGKDTHVLLHHLLPILRVEHFDHGVGGKEGRRRQRRRQGYDERNPMMELHGSRSG